MAKEEKVIHCRDCYFYRKSHKDCTSLHWGGYREETLNVKASDFCSWAKEKEEGDHNHG